MRIGCVTPHWGGFWNEEALIARRIASALSFVGPVDVLVPNGRPKRREREAALTVEYFPATPEDRRRRDAILRAVNGTSDDGISPCSCVSQPALELAAATPRVLQAELVRSVGGTSEELLRHLAETTYDAVVLVDWRAGSTIQCALALPKNRPLFLVPLAHDDPTLPLPIYDPAFERAQKILVTNETERELVASRISDGDRRVRDVGFVLQTADLALATEPPELDGRPFLVAVGDWTSLAARTDFQVAVESVRGDLGDLMFYPVGPAAETLDGSSGMRRVSLRTRLDLWRWMSRALGVVDWQRQRVLARDVLEAMLNGVPVIVREAAGAAREHAERGGGGVWFRTHAELSGCVRAIVSDSLRQRLGAQGRAYARRRYGDPGSFIAAVTAAVRD
jgi:glycosyltransferase involved in cell wall biosynthesis